VLFNLPDVVFIKIKSQNLCIIRCVERQVERGASEKRTELENPPCRHNLSCSHDQECFQQTHSTRSPAWGDLDVGDTLRWRRLDQRKQLVRTDLVHSKQPSQFPILLHLEWGNPFLDHGRW